MSATILALAAATAPANAAPGIVIPRSGDWEGVGPHRLPLSFELVRRHGRLVATSIAVGSPFRCPANERDAEAVSLSGDAYTGPGARRFSGGSPVASAVLSGRVPGGSATAWLAGSFTSAGSGTFSIQVEDNVGCGWPARTLSWQVHPASRQPVADGTWKAAMSGPGIAHATLRLVVAGQGRVINSFSASFICRTDERVGENTFKASPAYEFIRPGGDFYSSETGNTVKGHPTTWSGGFSPDGALSGTISIYDGCTKKLVRARFRGAFERARRGAGHDAGIAPSRSPIGARLSAGPPAAMSWRRVAFDSALT